MAEIIDFGTMKPSESGLFIPNSAVNDKLKEVYDKFPKLHQCVIKHNITINPGAKDGLLENPTGWWNITVFMPLSALGLTPQMGLQQGVKIDKNAVTMVPYPKTFFGTLVDVFIYACDHVPEFIHGDATGNISMCDDPVFINPFTGEEGDVDIRFKEAIGDSNE